MTREPSTARRMLWPGLAGPPLPWPAIQTPVYAGLACGGCGLAHDSS